MYKTPNRDSREWMELNECLSYVKKQYQGWETIFEKPKYEPSIFTDPFTDKVTIYSTNMNLLYRNGLEMGTLKLESPMLFALSHVACLICDEYQTYIYDNDCIYAFPLNSIIHVRFLYNINKCVLTTSRHSFVVIGSDEYTAETMDDLVLFSPSGPCMCFTESHAFVIYESNRCIVLAETLSPYRINPVKRIDESARRILYNHNKKEIVVNNEIVLSMFQHG
jgi:hypothetical protein